MGYGGRAVVRFEHHGAEQCVCDRRRGRGAASVGWEADERVPAVDRLADQRDLARIGAESRGARLVPAGAAGEAELRGEQGVDHDDARHRSAEWTVGERGVYRGHFGSASIALLDADPRSLRSLPRQHGRAE